MSTISGAESVRPNWQRRRTRPGLSGRRLVLTCQNEHMIPDAERVLLPGEEWHCRECGCQGRKWTWLCAPLWREASEWIIWGFQKAKAGWRLLYDRKA